MRTPATIPPIMGLDCRGVGRGGGVDVGVFLAGLGFKLAEGVVVEDPIVVVESPVVVALPTDDDKAPPSTCANLTTSFPAPSQQFRFAPQHHVSLFASSVPLAHGVICELPTGYLGLHIFRQAFEFTSGEVQKSIQ
jgi:hypothetical protein